MQDEWASYWAVGRTGFHRSEVHAGLTRYHELLLPTQQGRVLVPLCGKSLDLPWLASRCDEVVGSEWVEQAIETFFSEQGLQASRRDLGEHCQHQNGNLSLIDGDFLTLRVDEIGRFEACWDRAAMVALPRDTRRRYVPQLVSLMNPGGRILLVTYDTEKAADVGPPYCIRPGEVAECYAPFGEVELLESIEHTPESNPKVREKGLPWMREDVFLIRLPG
jgi:thiopurine S-methyltransferase